MLDVIIINLYTATVGAALIFYLLYLIKLVKVLETSFIKVVFSFWGIKCFINCFILGLNIYYGLTYSQGYFKSDEEIKNLPK